MTAMDSSVKKKLAQVLLVELLAYQLASPVQWIDTQDVLLKDQKTKRLIEVGPDGTLVSMAKKTLAKQSGDPMMDGARELLCYKNDQNGLRFEVEPPAKPLKPTLKNLPASVPPVPAPSVPIAPAVRISISPTIVAIDIPDAVPTAREVVIAIVASKLQKTFSALPMDKTIKQLAGGRSTLENEIVGDIAAEVGNLPDGLETEPLEDLCAQLQAAQPFAGVLGKPTQALITRLLSLKMPSGFSATQARAYMQSSWRLEAGRQNSVLIRAAASQPAARLGSESEARGFLDTFIQDYAKENGLDHLTSSKKESDGQFAGGMTPVPDPWATALYDKEREARKKRKIAFLSNLYGIGPSADSKAMHAAKQVIDALQVKLDGLYSELGDALASGIQPMLSVKKVRRFDSSWNWAMQDLVDTFNAILIGDQQLTNETIRDRGRTLANRSDERIPRVARFLLEKAYRQPPERMEAARNFLGQVLALTTDTQRAPRMHFRPEWTAAPCVTVELEGKITYSDVPRDVSLPFIQLDVYSKQGWQASPEFTEKFVAAMDLARVDGLSFRGKNVLITGAGPSSIGANIVAGLLTAGANVIVTTSSYTSATVHWYQGMYTEHAAQGAELIVVPFNQGSQQDVESLANYIFHRDKGLGWDLDHVIPFAAIAESGREVDGIDSKSELAHRVMLTNLVRLLGAIKKRKEFYGYVCRPTQVVLPLSPNHGVFGGDGLYAESKIALETLAIKWRSEAWTDYLSICGARIGWTRGTGLMARNDRVAAGLEARGLRTFSRPEMAFYLLLLMGRSVATANELEPISADLTGGMGAIPDLKEAMRAVEHDLSETVAVHKALAEEARREIALREPTRGATSPEVLVQANLAFEYPPLGSHAAEIEAAGADLTGMVDLDKVVVVTGFSEVGPWGNARTRWEMEASGRFSLEGCVEIAWIMGLIKHHDGALNGQHYIGWVDAETGKPVRDGDIKSRYEPAILQHTGIRLIEAEMDDGYEPRKKEFLQEIVLEDDLPPFQVAKSLAADIQRQHGDKVNICELSESNEECSVHLKKGATLYVPKALQSDRRVAGQIPAGWDAQRYGVPEELVARVDRVTLFALVSTAEALTHAGLTDPYEVYEYLHVSEVGNCIGSGVGGQKALKGMYKSRYLDKTVQTDVMAESFINTTAAWINMLLMSAAGPIRTPVGACATSLESLETGFETIVSGRARMCLVGGFDDLTEHVSSEFANMNVTTNDVEEEAKGRLPHESSRPTASSRCGFVESQGGGVQVVTSARLALDMGLPVHGIVAWVSTASDGVGRSVPAPGKGLLVNAREDPAATPSPLLDLQYRRRRLTIRRQFIQSQCEAELELLRQDNERGKSMDEGDEEQIREQARRQEKEALNTFGNEFWHNNPGIAPLRGALAVWGLTIDDLGVASFHGTSTKGNDPNETNIIQTQLQHLGRNPGNPLLGIFQKYLTGHAKGGAGAWMLNGCLQVLETGAIPGNRNADNVDAELRANDLIVFPNRTIHVPAVKAFSISSFGFGQKGAQAVGVHPRYLFATLSPAEYDRYVAKREARQRKAARHFHRAMALGTVFVAKSSAPYTKEKEVETLLNPNARFPRRPVDNTATHL